MNPVSLYEHKALLAEAVVVAGVAIVTLRNKERPELRFPAIAAGAWACVGVMDFLVYAFGYQLARLDAADVASAQAGLAWLRIPLVIAIAIGLGRLTRAED